MNFTKLANNMYFIIIVSLLLLIIPSLIGAVRKIGTIDGTSYFSKDQTNHLRGIAIMMIMYAHYYQAIGVSDKNNIIGQLPYMGYLGVAIFFLLSGYAVMISKINRSNYLEHFITGRLARLYVPFFIAFLIDIILMLIFGQKISWNYFIYSIFMSMPGTLNWYLKVQLILYILYYLVAIALKNNQKIILVIFVLCFIYMVIGICANIDYFWFESSYIFPLGMAVALYKEQIFYFLKKNVWFNLLISVLILGFCYVPYYLYGGVIFEIVFILGFVQFIICLCAFTEGTAKYIKFIGKISLELYLSHLIVINFLNVIGFTSDVFAFFTFIIISVLIAITINKLSLPVINRINKGFER